MDTIDMVFLLAMGVVVVGGVVYYVNSIWPPYIPKPGEPPPWWCFWCPK